MRRRQSISNPDVRTRKVVQDLRLSHEEIERFLKAFRKIDKKNLGKVTINQFYNGMLEKRSIFGDSLFELLSIKHKGMITFGEWLHIICTYCLFEKEEILKFCFYVFDKDRNGYVHQEEMDIIISVLYHLLPGEAQKGNTKVAIQQLKDWFYNEDGKIDFDEFRSFHKQYPSLLYPAFRMQYNMMLHTLGETWWQRRKALLKDDEEEKKAAKEKAREEKIKRKRKLRLRRIRKKLGCLTYYLCPILRWAHEQLYPQEPPEEDEDETEAQRRERLLRERQQLKREHEIALKNPETEEWHQYLRKKKLKVEASIQSGQRERIPSGARRERLEQRRERRRKNEGP